jgi:hypothetical protein
LTRDSGIEFQLDNKPLAQSLSNDKTLVFESRFESGNLRKAMKVGPFEYELYLKNDYGTSSFT